jgi:holliday junction DNA helicase RuvA
MIGKLTGSFGGTTPEGLALIDVAGVGYAVRVPLPALLSLQTSLPERIALFVHTAVREDAIDLYGFFSEEELSFFKQLMSVSGIGPKTALAVLNNAEVHALKHAIAQGDTVKLIKVFGIGKKSAERMVLELRDKLTIEVDIRSTSGSDAEVIEALLSLGYRADEAREAVKALQNKESNSVQEKLAHALKYLGSSLKAL